MTLFETVVYGLAGLPLLGYLAGAAAVCALRSAYRRALAWQKPAPVDPLRDYAAWKADRRRRDAAEWQDEWLRLTGTRHTPEADAILATYRTDANGRPVHSGGLIAGPGDNRIEDTRLDGTPGPRYTEAARLLAAQGLTGEEARDRLVAALRPPYRIR